MARRPRPSSDPDSGANPGDLPDRVEFCLGLADDQLVLGHRLSEWCGHAPTLEEDLALANMGLDLIGQAREIYAHAARLEARGRTEDCLAYLRGERAYRNLLLVEYPNTDFAHTVLRQFYYAAFMVPYWRAMTASADECLRAVAAKAEKEIAYHLRHSAQWVIRLGDGTAESARRMAAAIDNLHRYTGEMFETGDVAVRLIEAGIAAAPDAIRGQWQDTVQEVFDEAGLALPPAPVHMQIGGRAGRHTEHLGHLLSELQYLQRTYPGARW